MTVHKNCKIIGSTKYRLSI